MAKERKYRGEVPLHDNYGPEAKYAVEAEALLPTSKHEEEIARGLELGLPAADSIKDRRIPTFSRGELPHFAGIIRLSKRRTSKTYASVVNTMWPSERRLMAARPIDPARVSARRGFEKFQHCMDPIASSSAWVFENPLAYAISAMCLPFLGTSKRRLIRSVKGCRTCMPAAHCPWCSAATILLALRPCEESPRISMEASSDHSFRPACRHTRD